MQILSFQKEIKKLGHWDICLSKYVTLDSLSYLVIPDNVYLEYSFNKEYNYLGVYFNASNF